MKTILLLCFVALSAQAADLPPLLGKPGKLLFEDDFNRAEVKPKWRPGLGFWAIQDGVLSVEENPADKHGAYAYAMPAFGYKDFVAEYSFKLNGSTNCDLKIEDSNWKDSHAGHIVRISITPKAVTLGDSKNGTMENGFYAKYNAKTATPEEKKALMATIKDTYASFKIELDLTQWHKARAELVGDEVILIIDGKVVGYLKAAGVAHPTKNLLGFTIGGKSTLIDNVKVWEASAATDWSTQRADVLAALPKK